MAYVSWAQLSAYIYTVLNFFLLIDTKIQFLFEMWYFCLYCLDFSCDSICSW